MPGVGRGWGEGGALAGRELVTNRYKIIIKEVRMKKKRESLVLVQNKFIDQEAQEFSIPR